MGCPACAGIDRSYNIEGGDSVGLPRMRGDRPMSFTYHEMQFPVAPHARDRPEYAWLLAHTSSVAPHARG